MGCRAAGGDSRAASTSCAYRGGDGLSLTSQKSRCLAQNSTPEEKDERNDHRWNLPMTLKGCLYEISPPTCIKNLSNTGNYSSLSCTRGIFELFSQIFHSEPGMLRWLGSTRMGVHGSQLPDSGSVV